MILMNTLIIACGWIPIHSATTDPKAVIANAAKACQELRSVQYTAESKLQGRIITAEVTLQRATVPDSGLSPGKYYVKGADSEGKRFEFGYDGQTLRIRESDGKTVRSIEGPSPYQAGQYLPFEAVLVSLPFLGDFFAEVSRENTEFIDRGVERIATWQCDRVEIRRKVTNPAIGETTLVTVWSFDQKTHLPIRMTSDNSTCTVKSLTVNPKVEEETFHLIGKEVSANPQGPATDKLLTVGSSAPNFTLRSPDGKQKTLKDFKGRVLILDFWGTWCVPCRKTMPILQGLHERYSKNGLTVVGISVADREADPAAFMKRMGLTYQLLLNGDSAAKQYKAVLLPTLYVIDKSGKIVYRQAGVGEDDKAQLTKIVEKLLSSSK